MSVKTWLRGVKDSAKFIIQSLWKWLRYPPADLAIVLAAALLVGCPKPPNPTPTPPADCRSTGCPDGYECVVIDSNPEGDKYGCVPREPEGCYPPASDSTGWKEHATLAPEHVALVLEAEAFLGNVCGNDPEQSLNDLGARLRYIGYCAGRLDDAVFVRRTDDQRLWSEYHAVAYETGCWTGPDRVFRGVWKHE